MKSSLLPRLPDRKEILLLFWAAVLPIHIWGALALLGEIPGYVLRFDALEILTVCAYVAVFALIESLAVTLIFVVIRLILPLLKDSFVPKSISIIWLTGLWVIPVHAISFIHQAFPFSISSFQIMIFLWIMGYIATILWIMKKIKSSSTFSSTIMQFANNISILALAYLLIDVLGLILIGVQAISR